MNRIVVEAAVWIAVAIVGAGVAVVIIYAIFAVIFRAIIGLFKTDA